MIIDAARAAFTQLLSAEFRSVMLKSLGTTLLTLIALWFGLWQIFDALALPYLDQLLPGMPSWAGWLGMVAAVIAGIGFAAGLALLIAPVSALVAGLFLDDIADVVERTDYPQDPPGRALPMGEAIWTSVKFFAVVILGNLFALFMLLIPGVNLIAFFLVNGYLLGREFFEFAAMRFLPEADAKALRRRHAGQVFLAGLVIAGFLAVPLLNLMTPLFAAAMMVHLYKGLAPSPARAAA